MPTTKEGKVKKAVREILDPYVEAGLMYYNMPVPTGYGEPMLDFVGCFMGDFFAIETKAPGEKLTPRQEFTKERMEKAGAKVFVIGCEITRFNAHASEYSGLRELREWLRWMTGEAR